MENLTIFDILPEDEALKFKPKKSDDWKWNFSDYPPKNNGLKVFSCFACGGVVQWAINLQAVRL